MEIYKVKFFGNGDIEYYAVPSLIELAEKLKEMEEVARSIKFIASVDVEKCYKDH